MLSEAQRSSHIGDSVKNRRQNISVQGKVRLCACAVRVHRRSPLYRTVRGPALGNAHVPAPRTKNTHAPPPLLRTGNTLGPFARTACTPHRGSQHGTAATMRASALTRVARFLSARDCPKPCPETGSILSSRGSGSSYPVLQMKGLRDRKVNALPSVTAICAAKRTDARPRLNPWSARLTDKSLQTQRSPHQDLQQHSGEPQWSGPPGEACWHCWDFMRRNWTCEETGIQRRGRCSEALSAPTPSPCPSLPQS